MRCLILFLSLSVICLGCKNNPDSQHLEDLLENAQQLMDEKSFDDAVLIANEALEGYTVLGDSSAMANSLYLAARASALNGDFEEAKAYGEQASTILVNHTNYELEYKLNNILSWSYFELGRGFEENRNHNQRQLFVVDQLNDDAAKAMVYNNYGYDATVSGAIPLNEAITYSQFANDYYAQTEGTKGRWYTLMNLTWQHRLINDMNRSEAFGSLAVEQAKKDDDRHAIIEVNTNLGETLLAQDKVEEARPLYEDALAISLQKQDRDKYVFDVYYSRFLWKTGKKEEAIALLKQAVEFLKTSEVFYEMLGRAYLAYFSSEQGDLQEVNKQLEVFKNPRAEYFSQEAKILAMLVEAKQLKAENKPDEAVTVLQSTLEELDISGATLLIEHVQNELDQLL